MTQTDKEKLRMAKNLVKANNKKIKKVSEHIVVEMERWTRTVEEYSDEEKLSEIKRLRFVVVQGKQILEK